MNDEIAYCGVNCSECDDYRNGICVSCRRTGWPEDGICMPVKCCMEKQIEFCGCCNSFPCESMAGFYQESDSHRKAYRQMCAVNERLKAQGCR